MRFRVSGENIVRKLNVTDRWMDGALQYLPSRAFGAAGDNKEKGGPKKMYPSAWPQGQHCKCQPIVAGTRRAIKILYQLRYQIWQVKPWSLLRYAI